MAAKKKVAVAAMKNPKIQVYLDRKLEWRWRLIAKNGRIIADSGEGYKSKTVAKRMPEKVFDLLDSLDDQVEIVALTAKQTEKIKAAKAAK